MILLSLSNIYVVSFKIFTKRSRFACNLALAYPVSHDSNIKKLRMMSYRLCRPYERKMIILCKILRGVRSLEKFVLCFYRRIQHCLCQLGNGSLIPCLNSKGKTSIYREATMLSYRLWRPYERSIILFLYNILSGF